MLWIAAQPPRASTHFSRPHNIVVIEHINLYRQTLVDLLKLPPLDASVTAHAASDTAVAAVVDAPPDLVICEFDSMPLRGPDVVRALSDVHRELKVVLLLEEPDGDALALALRSGAVGVFTKQTEPDLVVAGILAVLQGCRSLSGDLVEMLVEAFERPVHNVRARGGDRNRSAAVVNARPFLVLPKAGASPAAPQFLSLAEDVARSHEGPAKLNL